MESQKARQFTHYRIIYLIFTALAVVMVFLNDFAIAGSLLSLALVFDPQVSTRQWSELSVRRKFLVVVQFTIAMGLIGLSLYYIAISN